MDTDKHVTSFTVDIRYLGVLFLSSSSDCALCSDTYQCEDRTLKGWPRDAVLTKNIFILFCFLLLAGGSGIHRPLKPAGGEYRAKASIIMSPYLDIKYIFALAVNFEKLANSLSSAYDSVLNQRSQVRIKDFSKSNDQSHKIYNNNIICHV